MSDELDDFINDLQGELNTRAIKDYGQAGFERWKNPPHNHPIKNPDGYASVTGSCGDTMEIFLKFKGDKVKDASFQTNGCGPSIICGSLAAELAFGKNPEELTEITNNAIINIIGGRIPEEDMHCASLAAETLQEALSQYMKNKQRSK
ncbi:MAG: iron-sulfur cluster assembly scaffold protein [Spirochaetes bacterium]|nr:iron-sulfur cluster assembly scaffold protein [Spirochaetota bacterium]